MSERWPQAYQKLIEEKANGAALIAFLKREISGLIPYIPKESKESRVATVSPMIESGNVWLPAPALYP